MNLKPRIDSVSGALNIECRKAGKSGLSEPFEMLLDKIETDIARYIEYGRK